MLFHVENVENIVESQKKMKSAQLFVARFSTKNKRKRLEIISNLIIPNHFAEYKGF